MFQFSKFEISNMADRTGTRDGCIFQRIDFNMFILILTYTFNLIKSLWKKFQKVHFFRQVQVASKLASSKLLFLVLTVVPCYRYFTVVLSFIHRDY